jgi:hypothetical protein
MLASTGIREDVVRAVSPRCNVPHSRIPSRIRAASSNPHDWSYFLSLLLLPIIQTIEGCAGYRAEDMGDIKCRGFEKASLVYC